MKRQPTVRIPNARRDINPQNFGAKCAKAIGKGINLKAFYWARINNHTISHPHPHRLDYSNQLCLEIDNKNSMTIANTWMEWSRVDETHKIDQASNEKVGEDGCIQTTTYIHEWSKTEF